MRRRIASLIFIPVVTAFLVACQVTTGQVRTKEQVRGSPSCEPMPITEASVNWAVFGTVTGVKNCPGQGHYNEKYKLANGWGGYQQANSDNLYFYEIDERIFREALIPKKAFAAKATTIKLHYPKLKDRPAIFVHTRASGKNLIYFVMNSGSRQGEGWSKILRGSIYDDGNMSEEAFRKYFLERLRVLDTPAAESFIASHPAKKSETKISKATISTSTSSPSIICRDALAPSTPLRWDDGTFSKPFVMEAQRRGLSPEACGELLGRADEKYAIAKLTDSEVCRAATTYTYNYNSERWRTGPVAEAYKQEAMQRGLSLKDCLALAKGTTTATQPATKASIEKRLRELKKLLDNGLITQDEAAKKRKGILSSL